jgi:glutamate/tyrosine decarboxylase-like PLP-dependent enzyme
MDSREAALSRAHELALTWLGSLEERSVVPVATAAEVADRLGRELPAGPTDPLEVVDLLASASADGLTAMSSGRFFGFVIGGTHPAGLAADWLVSAWDQNNGLRAVTPATAGVEDVAAAWLLDLLGLPPAAAVGFTTGATMANFTALASARGEVLRRAGWDVDADGLTGAPRLRVLVGEERHNTVDLGLRYLGLGRPEVVPADEQGRMTVDGLKAALDEGAGRPTIVVLQAGNIHSGSFDPFPELVRLAHEHDAWVHVDGAFGLFAAASERLRHLTAGYAAADSWGTDAHKTLSVPYDCGIVIVRDPVALTRAMSLHGDFFIQDAVDGDPFDRVPEVSRRARGVPLWAVLRALGRTGVSDLVDRLARHARGFADGFTAMDGAEVVNEVPYTQVCVSFGSDERTREVVRRVLEDGTAWMSGSIWRGRAVLRISVCDQATTDDDVERCLAAVQRVAADVPVSV